MMFHADGSASTSGWTFHGDTPQYVKLIGASREVANNDGQIVRSRTNPTLQRSGVHLAIYEAAARHERNRALAAVGLSAAEWQMLFRSLIKAESAFNPKALSPKGAIGLGQLMPDTARQLGVDPHDMTQNLDGAARYLLAQLSRFGSVELALAAYNAGPHRVEKYGGVPPFRETQAYIARINRFSGGLAFREVVTASAEPTNQTNTRSAVVLDVH